MLHKISHIGIAVKDLTAAVDFYKKLGLDVEATEFVESQKVKVAFIPIGNVRIELLEATSEDSPVAKFLEKKGEGIHHLAFGIDNLELFLKNAAQKDIRMIDKTPRKGAHNTEIAFLHPKSSHGVLMEICQDEEEDK